MKNLIYYSKTKDDSVLKDTIYKSFAEVDAGIKEILENGDNFIYDYAVALKTSTGDLFLTVPLGNGAVYNTVQTCKPTFVYQSD